MYQVLSGNRAVEPSIILSGERYFALPLPVSSRMYSVLSMAPPLAQVAPMDCALTSMRLSLSSPLLWMKGGVWKPYLHSTPIFTPSPCIVFSMVFSLFITL